MAGEGPKLARELNIWEAIGISVALSGSLSGAARVLNTTQPTLSRQLGQLGGCLTKRA